MPGRSLMAGNTVALPALRNSFTIVGFGLPLSKFDPALVKSPNASLAAPVIVLSGLQVENIFAAHMYTFCAIEI